MTIPRRPIVYYSITRRITHECPCLRVTFLESVNCQTHSQGPALFVPLVDSQKEKRKKKKEKEKVVP